MEAPLPSRETLEAWRLPLAALLLLVVGILYWSAGSRGGDDSPRGAVAAGPVQGEVLGPEPASPVPTLAPPTATPIPTPDPTPAPTPPPGPFDAQVHVCQELSGAECHGEVHRFLPRDAQRIVALVLFTNAWPGDVIEATLVGPEGALAGGPFALDGGGTGYYYATFDVASLPGGRYEVVATRNADEVASTDFLMRGWRNGFGIGPP
jgi:hypothetical protein